MTKSALIDACVLANAFSRDLLLQAAAEGAFEPRWSPRIECETIEAVTRIRVRKGLDWNTCSEKAALLIAKMNSAFPYASRPLPENSHLTNAQDWPDPDDVHVVEAALYNRVDVIITENIGDFPDELLPGDIAIQTADEFLARLVQEHPTTMLRTLEAIARRTGREGTMHTRQSLIEGCRRNYPAFYGVISSMS